MFKHKGYFQTVPCPFYEYGLCHRPYCHFKHSKEKISEEKVCRVEKKDKTRLGGNRFSTPDDEVMQIVKRVPAAKPMEQRKKEEEELKVEFAKLDMEKNNLSLIDAFYSKKSIEIPEITNLKHATDSLIDITLALPKVMDRKICDCDDPECSGFVEDHPLEIYHALMNNDDDNDLIQKNDVKSKNKFSDLEFFGSDAPKKRKKRKSIEAIMSGKVMKLSTEVVDNDKDSFQNNIEVATKAPFKKRIARSNEGIVRNPVLNSGVSRSKKLSYISPSLTAPAAKTPPETKALPTQEVQSSNAGIFKGKQRIAHARATIVGAPQEQFVRPTLKMETSVKVPHNLRQRYLNKIIDEFVPKCESEAKACEKAFYEEALACQRSSRKQIYMNLCANIIKKARSLPAYVHLVECDESDPMESAHATTLHRIKSSSVTGYKKVSIVKNKAAVKNVIKPPSSTLIRAVTPSSNKLLTSPRISTEPVELNEETFYDHLKQHYLLSDGQLWENKFPQCDPEDPTKIIIKDYVALPADVLKRVCSRCGKEYYMNAKGKYVTREECNYHWGRLRRKRVKGSFINEFDCCQTREGGTPCAYSRLHVCEKILPLENFATTEKSSNEDAKRKVLALDCEMCYTTQGLELTRLTVVDFYLQQMIDLFVKPANPIVDYNTRFSGVTKEDLQEVETTIDDVHDILKSVLHSETILLGHSLESDLFALKIVHRHVVDTSLVFPHRLGLPFKRALRNLMEDHLRKIIQNGACGHDSCEDASACMELMKHKFVEDNKKNNRNIPAKSFYSSK